MRFKQTFLKTIGLISFVYLGSCQSPNTKPKSLNYNSTDTNYVVNPTFGSDDSLNQILEVYRKEKDLKMNKVLTTTKQGLTKARPQSALTNLMADVCLEESRNETTQIIDFSIVNFGGIRSSVPKGEVTLEDVYKLMPFDNTLCVLEIHKDSVQSMANYIVRRGGEPISGLQLTISNDTLSEVLINDKPLDTKNSYWLATSDYLANGGDKMHFLSNPIQRIDLNLKVRDALIQSFERQEELNPSQQKRIIYVGK